MGLTHRVYVAAPVGQVFEFCREPAHLGRWYGGRVDFVDTTVTPSGVGSSCRVSARGVWGPTTVVTLVIPNRLILAASSSPRVGVVRYEFAEQADGTRLTVRGDPRGVWGLPGVGALVRLGAWRRDEAALARLKAKVEFQAAVQRRSGRPVQLGLQCTRAAAATGWDDGLSPGVGSSLRVYALSDAAPAAVPRPRDDVE